MTLDLHTLLERAGLAGLQSLPIDRIDANPDNPRRTFDEGELAALAASIRERGLLQPIAVFPVDSSGRYLLRFGERRLRAARIAGLKTILAVVGEHDGGLHILDQVVENDQREELSALEIAGAIDLLIQAGMTKVEIAGQLGRPVSAISLYAALPGMPAHLRDLSNVIGLRTVHDLYRLWRRDDVMVDAFIERTASDEITRGEVRKLVARAEAALPSTAARNDMRRTTGAGEGRPGQEKSFPVNAVQSIADIGRVRVVSDGREGWLLYPARSRPGRLLIRFDGADDPREVSAETVTIVMAVAR